MADLDPGQQRTAVRLYTDRYLVRGRLAAAGELTEALNRAGARIELEEAVYDEFGSREIVAQVPFAQVNLELVLIAALDEEWAPAAEIVGNQPRDEVLVGLPPFRVIGRLEGHESGEELRASLGKGAGRFIRLDDATFWSESLNEPRTRAPWLAVNRERAHVIAPHEERDVWAGVADFTIGASSELPGVGGS